MGEKLREARIRSGLSQTQVAGTQITRNMLSQLENDQASPSVKTLSYLAKTLDVSVAWLMDEENTNNTTHRLNQLKKIYRDGDMQACLCMFNDSEPKTEEEALFLFRSAVKSGTNALEWGRNEQAKSAADIAASCRSIYLSEADWLMLCMLQYRIAIAVGEKQDEAAAHFLNAYHDIGTEVQKHLVMAEYYLAKCDCPGAERELSFVEPGDDSVRGMYCFLRGKLAIVCGRDEEAQVFLIDAERTGTLPPRILPSLYEMLETCFRKQEDYKMAYHYALLRLELETDRKL